jgi:hypothetical protein
MSLASKKVTGYHGTTAGIFDEFVPQFRKGEQLGFGVHFAEERTFAELYALNPMVARKGKRPTIYVAELDLGSPLVTNKVVAEGSSEFALAKHLAGRKLITVKNDEGIPCVWLQNAVDATNPSRAQELITQAGFDSVIYRSRVGTAGVNARITAESLSYIVFKNSQIRILSVVDLLKERSPGPVIGNGEGISVVQTDAITKTRSLISEALSRESSPRRKL